MMRGIISSWRGQQKHTFRIRTSRFTSHHMRWFIGKKNIDWQHFDPPNTIGLFSLSTPYWSNFQKRCSHEFKSLKEWGLSWNILLQSKRRRLISHPGVWESSILSLNSQQSVWERLCYTVTVKGTTHAALNVMVCYNTKKGFSPACSSTSPLSTATVKDKNLLGQNITAGATSSLPTNLPLP